MALLTLQDRIDACSVAMRTAPTEKIRRMYAEMWYKAISERDYLLDTYIVFRRKHHRK